MYLLNNLKTQGIFLNFSLGFIVYNASRVLIGLNENSSEYGFKSVALFGIFVAIIQVLSGANIGKYIDYIGSMKSLTLGTLILVIACVIGLYMNGSIFMLALYAASLSIATLFINVASQKGVGETSDLSQRTRLFSFLSLLVALTNVVGPICIGFIVSESNQFYGYLFLLIVSLISFFSIFFVVILIQNKEPRSLLEKDINTHHTPWKTMFLFRQFDITFCSCVLFASVTSFILFTPIIGADKNFTAREVGVIIGVYGGTALISRLFISLLINIVSERVLLLLGFLLAFIGFVILAVSEPYQLFLLASILLGVGFGWGLPLTISLTHQNSRKGQEGVMLAKLVSLNKFSEAIVLFLSLIISTSNFLGGVFLINATLIAISVFALTLTIKVDFKP